MIIFWCNKIMGKATSLTQTISSKLTFFDSEKTCNLAYKRDLSETTPVLLTTHLICLLL